ncbi:MAG TPA: hypothetical protein VFU86_06790 [Terriglobales bacterium]|nr:hypothetical protein [Terriglobales bacterium]
MQEQRPCRKERGWRKRPLAPPVANTDALESLQVIRETMERSAQFTALPGRGIILVGATALITSVIAARYSHWMSRWILIWVLEAPIAAAIAVVAGYRKSSRLGLPLWSGPGRRMLVALGPPIFAGAVLTLALFANNYQFRLASVIPGMWLLLYGTALMAAGAHSVPPIPVMGAAFVVLGAIVLAANAPFLMNSAMALGFGGLHVGFGWYIARKHGG